MDAPGDATEGALGTTPGKASDALTPGADTGEAGATGRAGGENGAVPGGKTGRAPGAGRTSITWGLSLRGPKPAQSITKRPATKASKVANQKVRKNLRNRERGQSGMAQSFSNW